MANEKISIIIAESAPVIAAGLNHCLRRLPGLQTSVSEACTMRDLEALMQTVSPDVIVINPAFGGVFDPTAFRARHTGPYSLVALCTGQLSPTTRRLYNEAITVVDDLDTLGQVIRQVTSTPTDTDTATESLSPREKEVITLVVKGMTNKEIADRLFLSPHTVMTHRRNIARKLEIHSATGLTIYAIVNHLVDINELDL